MTFWNDIKPEIQLARVAATQSAITHRDQWEMQKNVGKHIIFDWYFHEQNLHWLSGRHDWLTGYTMKSFLRDACKDHGATVLDTKYRSFGDDAGYTFAIILAESHATCHTWPEYGLATFDIFTCGDVDPKSIMKTFRRKLDAAGVELKRFEEQIIHRGFVHNEYDVNQLMMDLDS